MVVCITGMLIDTQMHQAILSFYSQRQDSTLLMNDNKAITIYDEKYPY